MRKLILPLILTAALALNACGKKPEAAGDAASSEAADIQPTDTTTADAQAALEAAAAAEPVAVEAGSASATSSASASASS